MLGMIDEFMVFAMELGMELIPAKVTQTLTEGELIQLVPNFDGWIIGDDPATKRVFKTGKDGQLKAAVKWGIGVDNVDFTACKGLCIPVCNTPGMFGGEVADIAVGYVIALARHTVEIDRLVRAGEWPKPRGISLSGRTAAVVGYGDIGKNTAKRLLAAEMEVIAYDPFVPSADCATGVTLEEWPHRLEEADFVIVNCGLTSSSHHLLNSTTFSMMKSGVRIVNVGRGPVIDEIALISALENGIVHSAALDVFEEEPLPSQSPLRQHSACIFGSHNASNTVDGVRRTSEKAIMLLGDYLKGAKDENRQ